MLNKIIAKTLPLVPKPIVRSVANRYIAGESLGDAVATVKHLNDDGAKATIDVLGEFVDTRERAVAATRMASEVLKAIHHRGLRSGLSVKLTSLGLDIDVEFCYANLKMLVTQAREHGIFIRIDMENSPYTSKTLSFYKRLREEGIDNVGVVIQAYMKRSEADITALAPYKASVRLCKGIYNESEQIAYKDRLDIQENFKSLLRMLIQQEMFVGIATHDDVLLEFAENYIRRIDLDRDRYEFQMLLGVRSERRRKLLTEGHQLRVYVPFGEDWYGYSVRRLMENPQIAGHVVRAMFTNG